MAGQSEEGERFLGREFGVKESPWSPDVLSEAIVAWLWLPELAFKFCHSPHAGPWAEYPPLVNLLICVNDDGYAMLLKGVRLSNEILQRQKKACITPRGLRAYPLKVRDVLVVSCIILKYI